jgi:hypothetical protein
MGFFQSVGNFFKSAWNVVQNAVNAAIDAIFRPPLAGVFIMIENFKRIVCFLESVPKRARNVTAGVSNIFLGVERKFQAIGKSLSAGFEATSTLFAYSGEYAGSRLRCIIKFIQNFYKCVFFYILKSIGSILLTIILVPITFIGSLFGVNMQARIDQIGEGIITVDYLFYSIVGFHLIYFPESVRKDCFTCVRLKGSAVSKRADELKYTFNTRIPYIMTEEGGDPEFRRANNQFAEMSVLVPREPHEVPST